MDDVEPLLFFLFSNPQSKFGAEVYHPLLIGGPISVVHINGRGKSFFRPVVFGNKVMVNKTTSCAGVQKG